MNENGIHRRELFRGSGASALAMTAASYSSILGANDRIGLGVIGCGGRGVAVMRLFQKNPSVRVTAVCDVYGVRIDAAQKYAPEAKSFADHRKLLELKDVDAVLIGTPDHWHAGTAIDSLNAAKDVYVEKPLTRLIEEGPQIVRASRMNDRICQVGLQQRSGPQYIKIRDEYVKTGKLGKITLARTWWPSGPPRPLRSQGMPKPANLDWARFLGPVGWREWNPNMYFNFRAFLEFGGGKITDFFAHWADAVHMMLGVDNPVSAMTAGGIFHFQDGRTAPDSVTSMLEYPSGLIVTFECMNALGPEYGIEICGTEGRILVNRNRMEYRSAEKGAEPLIEKIPGDITVQHVENFLDSCRTRKKPNCDVYEGHRGTQAAHLAVIAYKERRRVRFDPDLELVLPS